MDSVIRRVEARADERAVVIAREFEASVEEVWEAFSDPLRVRQWFLPVSGELREGGRFQVEGNASGRILGCEPRRELRVTWEFGEQVSLLTLRVAEGEGGGAWFELDHQVPVDAHWGEYGPGAVGIGWDMAVHALSVYLDPGRSESAAELAAWAASGEGKAFITVSGNAWGAAQAAAGDDAGQAAAAAARTVAAYTGEG